jgi:spoIIIJ-associated protein
MGLFDLFGNKAQDKDDQPEVNGNIADGKVADGNVVTDDIGGISKDYLTELLDLMGFFNVVKVVKEEESFVALEIKGDDMGRIIGREGNTLFSLQLILRNMLCRKLQRSISVQVDANNYKDKRQNTLITIAKEAAQKVLQNKEKVILDPMNSWERRVVHMALQEDNSVVTESEGKGVHRQVVVCLAESS